MSVAIISISFTVLVVIIWGVITNNSIIVKKNRIKQSFGSIDVYLKQRFDLLPNLIATLKKYMSHEKELLTSITELRSKANSTDNSSERVNLSNKLSSVVGNISLENYPDLKADKQFIMIQYTITEIEEQLSASRRAYNASITEYNNKIQQFPTTIIASLRKDKTELLLETAVAERKNIDVKKLFED